MNERLLNTKQLAEALRISLPTAYRFVKEGMPRITQGRKHLYDLEQVNQWLVERNNASAINDLEIGKVYSNDEISRTFKCAPQGGMRRSTSNNSLVLFSDHSNSNKVYQDFWAIEEDANGEEHTILHYTGMGLTGDQSIEEGQNPTLANSNDTSIRVFLFVTWASTEHTFYGEVELFRDYYWTNEEDNQGKLRKVLKFPLIVKNSIAIRANKVEMVERLKSQKTKTVNPQKIKHLALLASKANKDFANHTESSIKVSSYHVTSKVYKRDPYIAELSKILAEGKCQLCEQDAPFKDEFGNPYLENHHITWLSQGGLDVIENCVALCSNCHKRLHVLNLYNDVQKLKDIAENYNL